MDAPGRRRGRRQADEDRRAERTQVFQKTKMCKFHQMGSCQRGSDCRFAHDQCELQHLPDLARTKICKTLLQTGLCEDPHCSYAHSREEYRVVPGFSAADQREAEMQLVQLDQMMRTGRLPMEARPPEPKQVNGQKQAAQPMYQSNLLCGTPVLFVPQLQSMVSQGDAYPPILPPNSPSNEKKSAVKDPPLAPQIPSQPHLENAMRLQAMTQFMQNTAAGSLNGYGQHHPGQSHPFAEARSVHSDIPAPTSEPANKAIGPSQRAVGTRGKIHPGARAVSATMAVPEDDLPLIPSEPAQIKLGSLRSLSSNSLPVQVDDDDDLQDRGIPPIGMGMGMPMGVSGQHTQALKVKNTFYDYETDCTPLGSRLRPVLSAAGRLDALGDEEETGLGGLTSMATVPSVISPSSAPPGVSDLQQVGGLSPNSDPLRRHDLADGLGSLFTVKNTFIECEEPQAEGVGLRAVHTAAGRLDMMWRDEEDRID